MLGEKKLFAINGVTVRLYAPVDLSKNWFFEWYEGKKRCRKYGSINREQSRKGREVAALHYLKQLQADILPAKSVEQFEIEEYLSKTCSQWRQSTLVNVKGIISVLFEWLDGKQLNRKNLEDFFEYLSKTRHPTTFNNYRMWLGQIFRAINKPGLLLNVSVVKTKKTPARYFQPHQIQQLRDFMIKYDPELWLYVQFVFYCFIRPSRELPHIKVSNIMLDEREILIWGDHSKNRKTQYVTIPDAFYPDLLFVYDMGPDEYIFPGRYDCKKPIGRNTMSARHRKILQQLNYGRGYCLYSWKHTGAIQAIKNGVGVNDLKIQLRHHSLQETDKYLRQLGVRDITNFREKMPDVNTISR